MRKTNENKQTNSKNCAKQSESKNVKNSKGCGKGCGKSTKDCK